MLSVARGSPSRAPSPTAVDPSHKCALRRIPTCQEGLAYTPLKLRIPHQPEHLQLDRSEVLRHQLAENANVLLASSSLNTRFTEPPHLPCQGRGVVDLLSLNDSTRKRSTTTWGKGVSHQSLRSACCHRYSEITIQLSSLEAYAFSTKMDTSHHASRHEGTAGGAKKLPLGDRSPVKVALSPNDKVVWCHLTSYGHTET